MNCALKFITTHIDSVLSGHGVKSFVGDTALATGVPTYMYYM